MWIHDYKSEQDNPYKQSPFVEITHLSVIDNLPLWTYPWHDHKDEFELIFIMEGKGDLLTDDNRLPVESGSVIVIQPGVYHRLISEGTPPMQYNTIRFLSEPSKGELQTFFAAAGTAVTLGINELPYIQNLIQLLLRIHVSNGGIVDPTFQTVGLSLLQLARTLFSNEALTLRISSGFAAGDILKFIYDHRADKITLESLSEQFHISPSHLSRTFARAYEMSPINYLIICRMASAAGNLLRTNLSVAEIAALVGYDNPAHFTNMFIKKIGCTPSEYREKNGRVPLKEKEE